MSMIRWGILRGPWALRIHGFGVYIFICRDREVYFSERYGYRKVRRWRRWALECGVIR